MKKQVIRLETGYYGTLNHIIILYILINGGGVGSLLGRPSNKVPMTKKLGQIKFKMGRNMLLQHYLV